MVFCCGFDVALGLWFGSSVFETCGGGGSWCSVGGGNVLSEQVAKRAIANGGVIRRQDTWCSLGADTGTDVGMRGLALWVLICGICGCHLIKCAVFGMLARSTKLRHVY